MKPSKKAQALQSGEPCVQYGALPWRVNEHPEILLVSTRGSRRWIIPKGWPMKGRAPHEAAEREALEEAGLVGKMRKRAIGAFEYVKRAPGGNVSCKVLVFPMSVSRQRKSWPESAERVTQWFACEEAAALVREPELSALMLEFSRKLEARLKNARKKKLEAAQKKKKKDRARKSPGKKTRTPKKKRSSGVDKLKKAG